MNIGNKITESRKAKAFSQTDFVKSIGVSLEMIGRYEWGEVMPPIKVAKKLQML
jgi:ribosome-binding protein aMBF1 (putative translation factor)